MFHHSTSTPLTRSLFAPLPFCGSTSPFSIAFFFFLKDPPPPDTPPFPPPAPLPTPPPPHPQPLPAPLRACGEQHRIGLRPRRHGRVQLEHDREPPVQQHGQALGVPVGRVDDVDG